MPTALFYTPALKNYDFGPGHAYRSDRFASFFHHFHKILGDHPDFQLINHDQIATDDELKLFHSPDYINIVHAAALEPDDHFDTTSWLPSSHININSAGPKQGPSRESISVYLSPDNLDPFTGNLPPGIETAARAAVKNSILAVDHVLQNRSPKTVAIGGGLHHAQTAYGEGFCIYNDVVIAARHALAKYKLDRILILDTDAHAGNGTCSAFYNDPRVLFIDLHQKDIYPYTGHLQEIGSGPGAGYTINLPLPPTTGDNAYQLIFDQIITPIANQFKPQLIIRNGGSDPHYADPLTNLGLTLAGFQLIGQKVNQLAAQLTNQKTIDLICSGYNPQILPQVWLQLISALSGVHLDFEDSPPPPNKQSFQQTKSIIKQLKSHLKPHWNSF
ncbi:MAG: hypothetical protein GY869_21965 [Planctomycetes bacterium]|nr:hypothetical protein [Planctomycetota bacterium]